MATVVCWSWFVLTCSLCPLCNLFTTSSLVTKHGSLMWVLMGASTAQISANATYQTFSFSPENLLLNIYQRTTEYITHKQKLFAVLINFKNAKVSWDQKVWGPQFHITHFKKIVTEIYWPPIHSSDSHVPTGSGSKRIYFYFSI